MPWNFFNCWDLVTKLPPQWSSMFQFPPLYTALDAGARPWYQHHCFVTLSPWALSTHFTTTGKYKSPAEVDALVKDQLLPICSLLLWASPQQSVGNLDSWSSSWFHFATHDPQTSLTTPMWWHQNHTLPRGLTPSCLDSCPSFIFSFHWVLAVSAHCYSCDTPV